MNRIIILFSLLLCLIAMGCRQHENGMITITGEIKGLDGGQVKLYTCPPSNLLIDSCEIRKGKYKLKGKLAEPQYGMLFFDVKPEYQKQFSGIIKMFLEPKVMQVYGELDNMKKSLKIERALLNDRLLACEKYIYSLPEYWRGMRLTDSVQLAYQSADMRSVRSMSVVRDSLFQLLIDRLFEQETDAAHSEVVAYLAYYYSSPLSCDEVGRIAERFAPDFRSYYYVRLMEQFASDGKRLALGKPFPDFLLYDLQGRAYSLDDFRGKHLFIEFSASWCSWCKKEIPYIRKAYDELKDKDIAFVTVLMETEREVWSKEIEKDEIKWICLSDLKGMRYSPLVKACNLKGLPDSFVIDPQGRILRRDLRGEEVLDYLCSICDKDIYLTDVDLKR